MYDFLFFCLHHTVHVGVHALVVPPQAGSTCKDRDARSPPSCTCAEGPAADSSRDCCSGSRTGSTSWLLTVHVNGVIPTLISRPFFPSSSRGSSCVDNNSGRPTAPRGTPSSRSRSSVPLATVSWPSLRKTPPCLLLICARPPPAPVPAPTDASVLLPELDITDLVHHSAAFHFVTSEPPDGRRFRSVGPGGTPGGTL